MQRLNVLLITLDQFRGDCLSCAGHPVVRTPGLDELAAGGLRLARHYAQAAPCAPGRAALYTGTYQMNNRVVANGTPLDDRFDNLARAARRAGYTPVLFGYTDQGIDPRLVTDPRDPRLSTYEGILPGFDVGLDLAEDCAAWLAWLDTCGHRFGKAEEALAREHERSEELSVSTYLTTQLLDWLDRQGEPWFAHASYFRPHPPYSAAGRFGSMYDPEAVPDAMPVPTENRHPLYAALLDHEVTRAPREPRRLRHLRAQYYGMISEVDAQLQRVWDWLRRRQAWERTVVVVTSDHGEQLGDQGLIQKAGFFEASYHVLGIIRDPRSPGRHGTVVNRFTENVDLFPTLCTLMGLQVPAQCDGFPLTPFLEGTEPSVWRDAAHYEFDWRDAFLPHWLDDWPWHRRLEQQHLAVRRSRDRAYVHFGDGSWRCFDLAADPTWRTEITDPALVLTEAQAMLDWRARHTDRTMTGMLLRDGGIGRFPPSAAWRP